MTTEQANQLEAIYNTFFPTIDEEDMNIECYCSYAPGSAIMFIRNLTNIHNLYIKVQFVNCYVSSGYDFPVVTFYYKDGSNTTQNLNTGITANPTNQTVVYDISSKLKNIDYIKIQNSVTNSSSGPRQRITILKSK